MSDIDVRAASRHVMAAALVSKLVKEAADPTRERLRDHMTEHEIRQVGVKDDDGQDLGTVYVGGNRSRKAVVVDPVAFLEWVRRTRPGDVVEVVRPSAERSILDAATKAGDPVDPGTGELIPGVEMHTGDPYIAAKPTPYARELMADTLARSGLLALPGGSDAQA